MCGLCRTGGDSSGAGGDGSPAVPVARQRSRTLSVDAIIGSPPFIAPEKWLKLPYNEKVCASTRFPASECIHGPLCLHSTTCTAHTLSTSVSHYYASHLTTVDKVPGFVSPPAPPHHQHCVVRSGLSCSPRVSRTLRVLSLLRARPRLLMFRW